MAEGRLERTQAFIFSADEGADVGEDGETPVVENYGIAPPYSFTGQIGRITVELNPPTAADERNERQERSDAGLRKASSD